MTNSRIIKYSQNTDFTKYVDFDDSNIVQLTNDQDIVFVHGPVPFFEQFLLNLKIYISLGSSYMECVDSLLFQLTNSI